MPVDHVCPHCQNRLAVPRRKVDVEFPCPRCGGANFISKAEAAERKAQSRAKRASQRLQANELQVAVGYDDVGNLLGASVDPHAWQQPMYPQAGVYPAGGWTAPQRSASQPAVNTEELQDLILVPKQMVLLQVMLFILLGPIAFGLGYWAASSGTTVVQGGDQAVVAAEAVPIKGEIKLPLGLEPHDVGAVVLALPSDAKLNAKFASRGLRPKDAQDAFAQNQEQAIHDLGGDVVRADAKGEFTLIVKRPGQYKVLIVSHFATRPAGDRPSDIDMKEMAKYFDNPSDLIGPHQYSWRGMEFKNPMAPLAIRFN